jgi:L,D-transpeptidase YcbB
MFNFRHPVMAMLTMAAFSPILILSAANAQTAVVLDAGVYEAIRAAGKSAEDYQAFYAARAYAPIWTGVKNKTRRAALLDALSKAGEQGLPASRYRADLLSKAFRAAKTDAGRGRAELMATTAYLSYARDVGSGVLEPRKVDRELAIAPPRRAPVALLTHVSRGNPKSTLAALAPKNPEYKRLLREKARLEEVIRLGGWGVKIPSKTLKPGTSHQNVVRIRQRLASLGYGSSGASPDFDAALAEKVRLFQLDHGLNTDGVVGPVTLRAMNASAQQRLQQVLVNLERQRWLNFARGERYIFVNLADFRVSIYDKEKVSFTSRTVVGKAAGYRTPEFYDQMTHMVINPTWYVPRSITIKEYLPVLRKDPGFLARKGMRLTDGAGRVVDPAAVDFSQYTSRSFPFNIRQRPSRGNALGRVKFMFPNPFNIYLHDTPAKSLFGRDIRAYSHGCVRVQKPLEFAYKLLERQVRDPKAAFRNWLNTGQELKVSLKKPVPVYLSYNTAFFSDAGRINYRQDTYGRDAKVFKALAKAGVVLQAVQG